ncbi:MAG: excinuclease ABC subunit UvrC [Elusimicrobia bacterium]|nr:excinuclease ABC subunit UvrC [Elusimicrobiota bacterium]
MRSPAPIQRGHLPHACGVYLMRDAAGEILYIGKANDLAKRVAHYFNPRKADLKNSTLTPLIRKIDYIPCASEREALILERRLIRGRMPFFNSMWKDDKSYPYVKVSLGEDFPRLTFTRKKAKDGGLYFGPYPKASPVKSLLRYLWKHKFFPLRPCRWEFSLKKTLEPRKINSCLYYHTGECPAPCAGKISQENYKAIAERAALFFKGEYAELKEQFEREMQAASRGLHYEQAAQLRDNIAALSQMGERVRVQAIKEEDLDTSLVFSQAVTDLQQALGLDRPPFHVECFDVSHFQGRQTVASMVCFKGGQPNRAHYRKFKIRETEGIDDFKSLREAVRRRYGGLQKAGELYPDLVLIDGGKGQLGAAEQALKELGAKIPLASLAKRLEEVFLPERRDPLHLKADRLALRLLQRLRDEAHRFGITYHRLLRGKKLFEEYPINETG